MGVGACVGVSTACVMARHRVLNNRRKDERQKIVKSHSSSDCHPGDGVGRVPRHEFSSPLSSMHTACDASLVSLAFNR